MDDNTKAQVLDTTPAEQAAEPTQTRTWTDAPNSANVRAVIDGHDWQLTIRADTFKELSDHISFVNGWLDKHGNGNGKRQPAQPQPAAQVAVQIAPPTPAAPPALPAAPAQPAASGPQEAHCQMIEVGTSYQGNKTQLKFHCNGFDNPLTYTKSTDDMAKLLAPLGFTAAHIVIGQKYAMQCVVTFHISTKDGKSYKNVDSVRATA